MAVLVGYQTSQLVALFVALAILRVLAKVVYNVFFHPLRAFPGPVSHAIWRVPYAYKLMKGTFEYDMLALHEKYGDIVRVAPDELAASHPDAWRDIMARRPGSEELVKSSHFYRAVPNTPTSILNAEREEHTALRRQLNHGFSEKSMREQEPLIKQYIDLLIQRLNENCGGGSKTVDLAAWYNFTTFDIIGDLTFGEPFNCLQDSNYHPFVSLILSSARAGVVFMSVGFFPLLKKILLAAMSRSKIKEFGEVQRELSIAKLRRRTQVQQRYDLIEGLLQKKNELNISWESLEATCNIIVIGGSETTATLLAGVTYLLTTHPAIMERLVEEVRGMFKSEDEINIQSVNKLTYMLACLNEAMRFYPPVPTGMPRTVSKNGCQILGNFVPENTIVAAHHWATYHREDYFTDPFGYHPERFLGDAGFANDRFEVLQPFHVGPRNCLGRKYVSVFLFSSSGHL
ncbi:hypothetical protein AWENTII_009632 [Aspergillus wentii]